jgi:FAD/FMN-containing dehydrogenase/Fe-S oxidoreductase
MKYVITKNNSSVTDLPEEARSLVHDLGSTVAGEVRFDAGSRGLYSTDASNYRQVPIGVVLPETIEDIVATVRAAHAHGVPVLGRGCGTSLAGQCCNAAVIIDTSKYLNRVLEIDSERRRARVQPGTILDDLRKAAARFGLTFGPDPATHNHCTLGGMIGNNSCGVHSVLAEFYGPGPRTADNIEELDVLTYDGVRLRVGPTSEQELHAIAGSHDRRGEIFRRLRNLRDRHGAAIRERFPPIPRRVSGYNLSQLLPENGFHLARALAGTESTCAFTLEATVTLIPSPKTRALLVLGYPTVYDAGDHIARIREMRPTGLEGLDDVLIHYVKKKGLHASYVDLFPEGSGWLLAEFGGDSRNDARDRAHEAMNHLRKESVPPSMALYDHPEEMEKIWTVRESGLGATAFVPGEPDSWPGWEDSAVPPHRVGEYLHDLRELFQRYNYHCSLYGHFGEGCIHTRVDFDFRTAAGIKRYRDFTTEAAELVVGYGGSISGEHGDGQARGDLLQIMYGADLMQAFRDFKSAWDPDWKMNPGKVIEAEPRDRNLRLGADYQPARPQTHFRFPEDRGDFSRAALRCVGVGECRRMKSGTMCPSFMATREEKHSTRGRARLLFEMLQGEVIQDGWRSETVKEALDLCLACKGCKNDCPVSVDMATYKAEFLSHYYENRLRPASAYAFGYIYRWARLAAWMPEVANLVTQTPGLRQMAKWIAGVAQERQLPRFAPYTFKQRAAPSHRQRQSGAKVILWADTFNNHFHPETAQAALEVLEAAGYRVEIPHAALCCGRPLYDFGMLDSAKRLLRNVLEYLRPELEAGTPIVVLEPSCAAVFRDELVNLFPEDATARRLCEQTFLLSELLDRHGEDCIAPEMHGKAIVQGHCHRRELQHRRARWSTAAVLAAGAALAFICIRRAGGMLAGYSDER